MTRAIVLDEESVNILSSAILEESWFNSFNIPEQYKNKICSIVQNNITYLISSSATINSRLLVIETDSNGFLHGVTGKDLITAFERSLVVALSQFRKNISPGRSWGRYIQRNVISIYATNRNSNESLRLYFDSSPFDTNHIYLYRVSEKFPSPDITSHEEEIFLDAVSIFESALEKCSYNNISKKEENVSNFGIELTEPSDKFRHFNYTLEQWYNNKLTSEQREFVDKDYQDPVRLRGAAGTGKTLALAVKLLKDAYHFEEKKEPKRLLFMTHSHSTCELVMKMITSMDEKALFHNFKYVEVKIASLYDLAQDILNYNLNNLYPIATDGKEGRELQYEILSNVLDEVTKNLRFVTSNLSKCSKSFSEYLLDKERRHFFTVEALNEFACILDAENIFLGSENSKQYINGPRESWQMNLDNTSDREVLLELHNRYREKLKGLNALSMDQMIADLSNHLRSHFWNRMCETEGYDAVFVDELHYFTKPERMVFNELCRSQTPKGRYPIFMAYDIKQSTNDIFLNSVRNESAANIFKSTGVGSSQLVELTKVFRYTPEIAQLLEDIDGSFPALDLASEWNRLKLSTDNENGDIPEIRLFERDIDLIDTVFNEASRLARRDVRKTVAVLCVNQELFSKYLSVGRIRRYYEAITDREDLAKLSKLKGKAIFSMPEYVAGLQFDNVYLIHIDKNELPEEITHNGVYRRFVSQVYLGSSRAKSKLSISSSNERRGISQILESAISNGSLIKIENQ
ncbi:UvrD-helicase domain-containing protein [Vibrio fluvialis]|uniref:UvrD-helicase domain-containing protein n=1 Tax=Vibrio fluvialis TaxID=676 RepID=UPI001EEB0688|nr:UvrD-helicase domain-containing protein [Vibrio fluvialis]EKO5122945.1 UvrD-helicase domain-containing protein [Vibrio fluvialis]MCG6364978.1 UvrD-helicase domain-containing protein [Vibrio fluvialis]